MNKYNIFKNSGIRGIAPKIITLWDRLINKFVKNKQTFFTIQNINFLGIALAHYLYKKQNKSSHILIAKDTRQSGEWIETILQNSLLTYNHKIFNSGIVPTPCIAKVMSHYKINDQATPFFNLGIIITASHNPAEYNGLKFFTPNGYLTIQDEIEISELFHGIKKNISQYAPLHSPKNNIQTFNVLDFYLNQINPYITPNTLPLLKIVLDCANGATYKIAEIIFKSYGIQTILINNTPNGNNINEQSGCSNVQLLINAVSQYNADWGCAFDGDGDRVIIVDKKNNIFDGDDILMLLSQHPLFKKEQTIIGTTMTNQTVENNLIQQGKTFIRTDVGERNIIEALGKHKAQLGAEACGHVTMMNHTPCSDGIFAALMFLITFYSKQTTIPTYTKLAQKHATIKLNNRHITKEQLSQITNKYTQQIKPGRLVIRNSNTEPIIRIMTEHQDSDYAEQTLKTIATEIQAFLKLKE